MDDKKMRIRFDEYTGNYVLETTCGQDSWNTKAIFRSFHFDLDPSYTDLSTYHNTLGAPSIKLTDFNYIHIQVLYEIAKLSNEGYVLLKEVERFDSRDGYKNGKVYFYDAEFRKA